MVAEEVGALLVALARLAQTAVDHLADGAMAVAPVLLAVDSELAAAVRGAEMVDLVRQHLGMRRIKVPLEAAVDRVEMEVIAEQ